MVASRIIRPQPGYQEKVLSSPADIVIGGGAAGVGKTFSLLLEPLRHIHNKDFGAVCFRRTSPQIRNKGGLWDASMGLYGSLGDPRESTLDWRFKSGASISFRHLQYEQDVLEWQGTEVPLIMFDELTHFSEYQFTYLFSRNRSTCGVKPYIRCTCNPDPESFVANLVEWWINPETGYPIPERDGVLRYFTKYSDSYIWGNTKEEVIEQSRFFLKELAEESGQPMEDYIKSFTFVSGSIYDNKELLTKDPAYLANLVAQDEQTMLQLLKGNWKVKPDSAELYNYYAMQAVFGNLLEDKDKTRRIIADIALEGSNKYIISVWEGRTMIDIFIIPKSDGKEVIEELKRVANLYRVPNTHIIYDADGVGAFVKGWAPGSTAFHGGAQVIPVKDPISGKPLKENYFNQKTQCYYRSAENVKLGNISILELAASKPYDEKTTVKQRIMYERKSVKKAPESDGKKKINKKEEQIAILGSGQSPDILDNIMMLELAYLKPARVAGLKYY